MDLNLSKNPKKNKKARRERLGKIAANIAKFTPKEKIQYCKRCKEEKYDIQKREIIEIDNQFNDDIGRARRKREESLMKLRNQTTLTIESEVMQGKILCVKHYKPTE
jgi:hypothetical protein